VIVADHNLIVTDFDSNEILTYPLGQTSPSSTISVTCPDRPAINKAENRIYVPETCSEDTVGVYDYPSGTLVTNLPIGGTGAALSHVPKF
jgi:DNA-binding beta-propeller fold protein YncE